MLCEASRKLISVLLPLLRARARARPVGPKSTPLLRIQEPTIVERRGGRPINFTTGSTIANRVDRSTRREPQHLSEILATLWARTLIFVI